MVVLTTREETRIVIHVSTFNKAWINAFFNIQVPSLSGKLETNIAGVCGGKSGGKYKPSLPKLRNDEGGSQLFCTTPPPLPKHLEHKTNSVDASIEAVQLPEQIFDEVSAVRICSRVLEPNARAHCVEDLMIAGVDQGTRMRILTASIVEARQRREAHTDLKTAMRMVEELPRIEQREEGQKS